MNHRVVDDDKDGRIAIDKAGAGGCMLLTKNQTDDIQWVADEVADLAVVLRSHGLGHLARTLASVQQALQHIPRIQLRPVEDEGSLGNVVSLEKYRKSLQ